MVIVLLVFDVICVLTGTFNNYSFVFFYHPLFAIYAHSAQNIASYNFFRVALLG